ncbi:MAG: Flagellar operon protein [Thermocaproicibacter melissae]|uniref:TIGR02530 family flagellar biosynthesis protein n=1 Tax=Thermocaproicibacter melissae TaxID=2966552 RepID=UPI0024B0BF6A|nr:TIGR02530 family flagellar biosynthesis protein [Thermocaproicibacter melissae]WBY64321.1 flagellar operon protein [Thermocaproicibacter melissae]
MNDIQFMKNYSALISPVYSPQTQSDSAQQTHKKAEGTSSFADMLQEAVRNNRVNLTFSKHAMERLSARQIEVSPQLMTKMSDAVDKAGKKGVTEALILNGNTAFIVNIPNRVVITSMNGNEMKENIFTNIDGAVIL